MERMSTEIFRENIKRFYIVSVEKQNEIEKIDKEISKTIKEITNSSNTIIKMQEEFLKEVEKIWQL